MPQSTQHSLIHVLLLWTTILSIIQAVFIILFFTVGHLGLSQKSSAVAPENKMQIHTTSQPPSEHGLLLGKGQMVTFKAFKANNTITWVAPNPSELLDSEGDVLRIKKDGYFFLNLQVTLKTLPSSKEHTVKLKCGSKVVLQGWIKTNTYSTGLLGKVKELSAGGTLEVTIDPPTSDIDQIESLTHLDIIYMRKP